MRTVEQLVKAILEDAEELKWPTFVVTGDIWIKGEDQWRSYVEGKKTNLIILEHVRRRLDADYELKIMRRLP